MAYTVADICRISLDLIGAASIASIDENTTEAKACSRLYAFSRDQVLRDFPWNFATKIITLSPITIDNTFGFDYAYQYPIDCMRCIKIRRELASLPATPYKIVFVSDAIGKAILTSQQNAELVYTARVENPLYYDDLFVSALSYRLAAYLAMPLTKDPAILSAMLQVYQEQINAAGRADAAEGQEAAPQLFNSFIDVRY